MSAYPGAELAAAAAPGAPAGEDVPPAAAAPSVAPGDVRAYELHDAYARPPQSRHQIILVVRAAGDGQVYGVPIGYADELAVFDARELLPVDEL
jgi:hypothetical protein